MFFFLLIISRGVTLNYGYRVHKNNSERFENTQCDRYVICVLKIKTSFTPLQSSITKQNISISINEFLIKK